MKKLPLITSGTQQSWVVPLKIFFVLFVFLFNLLCFVNAKEKKKVKTTTEIPTTSIRNPINENGLRTYILENGLTLIIKENHNLPLVNVDVWVKAGTAYETKDDLGVTHLLEKVLLKGSKHYKKDAFTNFIENTGGSFSENTSMDFVHYSATVSSNNVKLLLKIFADTIFNPLFPEDEIFKEKENIIDEIKERQQMGEKTVTDLLRQLAYLQHPYGQLLYVNPDKIRKLTQKSLIDFHKKFYVPNNISLVISGDVDTNKVFSTVVSEFENYKQKEITVNFAEEKPLESKREQIIPQDIKVGVLNLAYFAPSVKDKPDVYAMDLILTILGEGADSRLIKKLVQTNLAYDVYTDFLTQKFKGLFIVKTFYDQRNYKTVLQTILDEIENLQKEAVSEEELTNAKIKLLSNICTDVQTNGGMSSYYGFYWAIDNVNFALTYIPEVFKIQAQDIQNTALKYFSKDKYILVALKPK